MTAWTEWTEREDMADDYESFCMPLNHDLEHAIIRTKWAFENDVEPLIADLAQIARSVIYPKESE